MAAITGNRLLVIIATLQGFGLLGMYRAVEAEAWPAAMPVTALPAWVFVIVFPLTLLLALREGFEKRVLVHGAALTTLLVLCAAYIGSQANTNYVGSGTLTATLMLTLTIALFKGMMYLQQRAWQEPLTYSLLFTLSWRNFLTVTLALAFVGVVALVLMLWAGLFVAIGIEFFRYLFGEDWFYFPVLGFSFGVGVVIFRELDHLIDSVTRLLQGLIRLLLPIVMLLAVVFLASLAVVGVGTLWGTGNGTALVLWLMAAILFFVNAVYQDGRGETTYTLMMHRAVGVALFSLPFLAALSCYGLVVRVMQYGFTVERTYALLVWLVLTLFSLGYVYAVVRERDEWPRGLGQVNTILGLVLLGLMVVVNSPVLDPRKISVASQLERLASGAITIEELDVSYFRRELARPGREAWEELKVTYADSHPETVARWENPYRRTSPTRTITKNMRPPDLVIPKDLDPLLANVLHDHASQHIVIATDLDGDGENEYLAFNVMSSPGMAYSPPSSLGEASYLYRTQGKWMQGRLEIRGYDPRQGFNTADLVLAPVEPETPLLKNIRIGNLQIQPVLPWVGPIGLDVAVPPQGRPAVVTPPPERPGDGS